MKGSAFITKLHHEKLKHANKRQEAQSLDNIGERYLQMCFFPPQKKMSKEDSKDQS
jgi:hypothetical protein